MATIAGFVQKGGMKYMFLRLLKSFCIFARHGVNPFQPARDNADKIQKRFTEKEKQWYMDNAKTRNGKIYIRKILYGDNHD